MADQKTDKTKQEPAGNTENVAASGQPSPEVSMDVKKARTWAMSVHLAAFLGFLGIPFANIFGPLVIWLIKKDDLEIVDRHGIESLNFQISMTIYFLISVVLCFVIIGFFLLPLVLVANIILVIQAAVEASKGNTYRYPVTIPFIRVE